MNSDSRRDRGRRQVEIVQRNVADQVADVRHDPALAGLDEEVVPELLRVVAQRVGFARDEPEQRPQLIACCRIGDAIERRQQLEEAIGMPRQ